MTQAAVIDYAIINWKLSNNYKQQHQLAFLLQGHLHALRLAVIPVATNSQERSLLPHARAERSHRQIRREMLVSIFLHNLRAEVGHDYPGQECRSQKSAIVAQIQEARRPNLPAARADRWNFRAGRTRLIGASRGPRGGEKLAAT